MKSNEELEDEIRTRHEEVHSAAKEDFHLSAWSVFFIGLLLLGLGALLRYNDTLPLIYVFAFIIGTILTILGFCRLLWWDKAGAYSPRQEMQIKNQLEENRQIEATRQIAQEAFTNKVNELESQYGKISQMILFDRNSNYISSYIMVFEDSLQILLKEKYYHFSEIISSEIVDDATSSTPNTESTTKTSSGNMVGRAIVGGVLCGGIGALAGAATAKTTTTTPSSNTIVKHDYKIHITVNNLSNPMITLKLGTDEDKVRQIASLLAVIIERNKT